jgi:DNA ligase-1
MPLTKDPRVAARFMLAEKFENFTPMPLAVSMPKLNGIRAMWLPGRGFWSRDGVQYSPAVTAGFTIKSAAPLDGEFYVHGWDLQRINAAVGVNLDAPVADTAAVEFHVFDTPVSTVPAVDRMRRLADHIAGASPNVKLIQWSLDNFTQYDAHFADYVAAGYEGQMLKQPYSVYYSGRSPRLLKRKNWQFCDARVIRLLEGEGEFSGMLGGAEVRTREGLTFRVGTGKNLTHVERQRIWTRPESIIGKYYRIRYLCKSADGKPLNSTISFTSNVPQDE